LNRKKIFILIFINIILTVNNVFCQNVKMPEDKVIEKMKLVMSVIKSNYIRSNQEAIKYEEKNPGVFKCPDIDKNFIINFSNSDVKVEYPEPLNYGLTKLMLSGRTGMLRNPVNFTITNMISVKEANKEESIEVINHIKRLYEAYCSKNLSAIISMEEVWIENAAINYQLKKKGNPEDVWYAYTSINDDLIHHQNFKMNPFEELFISVKKYKDLYFVSGKEPILSSESVKIVEDDREVTFRLKVNNFILLNQDGSLRIIYLEF